MLDPGKLGMPPPSRGVLSGEERDALARAYDLGDWLTWQRTPKGRANVSFFVNNTRGRYVLRRSRSCKSEASLRSEVSLIAYLRRQGYPAPEVIPTRRGEGYAEHDGTFYLLTAFIPGGPYDRANPRHLRAAGGGLGRYHRLARAFPGPSASWPSADLPGLGPRGLSALEEVGRLAGRLLGADEGNRLEEALAYLRGQFLHADRALAEVYPGLSKLVVQGSFTRSALIFDGDVLRGVVDYDRTAFEARGLDLAYALIAFCRIDDPTRNDYRVGFDYGRCRDFLAAHRAEEPLPQEEATALPLLCRGQRLLKVLKKCSKFLAKNAVVLPEVKDVRKLATRVEQKATRLRWLEGHGEELRAAFLD